MLQELFTSKTRVKILTLFLSNPETRFYIREIARKTDENFNAVRRELQRLERIGLLESQTEGNMKYHLVNKKMPIYEELKSIFLKTEGVGKVIGENLAQLGKIKAAFIYGSFAKGEETLSSDIDMMIVGDVNEKKLIPLIRELEEKFSREINYVLFTSKEFQSKIKLKDPFITNVLKEEKIMLVGEMDGLR